MKKKTICLTVFVVVILITVGAVFRIKQIKENNIERAKKLEAQLLGTTFEGEKRTTKTIDKGVIKLSSFTDTNVVCTIRKDGTVMVTVTKSYCDGTAVITNGNVIYDDVETSKKEYQLGNVEISLSGNVKVELNGKQHTVIIDSEDEPIQIIVENVLCDII